MENVTLLKMGLFRAAHGWGGARKLPLPKICHTYPTKMKLVTIMLYLKKTREIDKSRDTPLESY